ncbi:MAG: hypothetical protein CVU06_07280 [Bacteroidetes bacterium HGW-Bacteroidetes-22]|nr:MAG: hypothetical protein CVU06_07280 [Bacteroidetes bacterium HGW-Bacteroidetes-22]
MVKQFITIYDKIPVPVRNVMWFSIITLGFHFLYRATASGIHSWAWVIWLNEALMKTVFDSSVWFNRHILGLEFNILDPRTMVFPGSGYVSITAGCSGLKQLYQVLVLFLLYPGPWRHKLWYIPMVMLAMHLTNLFRIISLSVMVIWQPQYWHFSHDWILRPLFYAVLFALWVVWVEKFQLMKKKTV